MVWLRRICFPALIAGFGAPFILGLYSGRPFNSMISDLMNSWISSGLLWGLAMAVAYVCLALPAARLLKGYTQANTALLLLLFTIAAGFAIPSFLLSGGALASVLFFGRIGATLGLFAGLVWLPFNRDLLCRSART